MGYSKECLGSNLLTAATQANGSMIVFLSLFCRCSSAALINGRYVHKKSAICTKCSYRLFLAIQSERTIESLWTKCETAKQKRTRRESEYAKKIIAYELKSKVLIG